MVFIHIVTGVQLMKVGDMVKNKVEGGITGVVVGWHFEAHHMCPIVMWSDGRCCWTMPHRVRLVC